MTETVRGIDPEVTVESAATVAEGTQIVVLSGTVSKVCATMGCWLEFKGESGATILVMNKDHAFSSRAIARDAPRMRSGMW